MDTLQDAYRDDEDDEEEQQQNVLEQQQQIPTPQPDPNENESKTTVPDPNPSSEPPPEQTPKIPTPSTEQQPESMAVEQVTIKPESEEPEPMTVETTENPDPESEPGAKWEPLGSEEVSTDSVSEDEPNPENSDKKAPINNEEEDQNPSPAKKQKSLSQLDPSSEQQQEEAQTPTLTPTTTNNKTPTSTTTTKKSSKKKAKGNNVWTKPTSRKGKKKSKNNNNNNNNSSNNTTPKPEETVLVTPIPRFPDKNDDSPDLKICLSKVYKAEKVELSEDRMSAGSCKGYRMVRATRGASEGAWYYEIKVVHLGETGHTRLGWSTEKGDLQAPVGYDGNSFGYRDVDGSKVHKALREKYGEEGYKEGDVIGFYINLPDGNAYAPKLPHLVWYKGQKYVCAPDPKEDPPKIVPGSEISFFKNGICQGVAFKDLYGGRYYPAASMYTLPNQPNCVVKFNFGPEFEYFPTEFEGRAVPRPMIEVPYHGFDNRVENGVVNEAKE